MRISRLGILGFITLSMMLACLIVGFTFGDVISALGSPSDIGIKTLPFYPTPETKDDLNFPTVYEGSEVDKDKLEKRVAKLEDRTDDLTFALNVLLLFLKSTRSDVPETNYETGLPERLQVDHIGSIIMPSNHSNLNTF